MSKHHLGDKFIVEVKEVLESNNGTLYRSNFSTLVFDDYGLDKLQKYDEIGHKLELIDELKQAEYNRGLADAWELAKKILNMKMDVAVEVFDSTRLFDVMDKFNPEEALAKIEAYEKEKSEIKVGDVVEDEEGTKALVIDEGLENTCFVFTENGCVEDWYKVDLKKTDKKISIGDLLRQIGE
jgi:hypothetical protein